LKPIALKHSAADKKPHSISRLRILDAAEKLFMEKGYAAVTMRDVAEAVGIRQASLYHHVPDGKEQLYVEIIERTMLRHREGLESVLKKSKAIIAKELYTAAMWFFSQPAIDAMRMVNSDLPLISQVSAKRLLGITFESTMVPIITVLEASKKRGEIRKADFILFAGAFLSCIQSLQGAHLFTDIPKDRLAHELIDIFLNGLLKS
jgi:TetR/AcrR family transcriptional regulator, cholesterol catabolism regulator